MVVNGAQHSYVVHQLLDTTLACLIAVLVLAIIALIWILLRARRRAEKTSEDGARHKWLAIGLTTLFFVAIDVRLFWRAMHDADFVYAGPSSLSPLRIEVNASQWAWSFRYAGKDDQFATADDVITVNQLWLPLGADVRLQLGSMDVIHSFSLPSHAVKTDVIPGRIARAWLRPIQLGQFEIACAQFCGAAHYRMRGVLHVLSQSDFAAWLTRNENDALAIAQEDARAQKEESTRQLTAEQAKQMTVAPYEAKNWGWPWLP